MLIIVVLSGFRAEKFVLRVVHRNLLDRLLLAAPINIWPYLLFPNFGFFSSVLKCINTVWLPALMAGLFFVFCFLTLFHLFFIILATGGHHNHKGERG